MSRKFKALLEAVTSTIRDNGYYPMYVYPRRRRPPYTYTIGLSPTYGHPELVTTGLGKEEAALYIETLASEIRTGGKFEDGEMVYDLFNMPVALIEIPAEWINENMPAATKTIPRPFRALQLVVPDEGGKLPWEEGADPGFHIHQPLLGKPPSALGGK